MRWTPAFVAFALVPASACLPQGEADPACSDEAGECPTYSKDATKVECDCTCDVSVGLGKKRSFSGVYETCLPPEVNRSIASPEARVAIEAMSAQAYGRRVFDVCSQRVAGFVESVARDQVGPKTLELCMLSPVSCRCSPRAAWRDGDRCDRPCPEIPCTSTSCAPLLRERGTLETSACVCSRTRSCNRTVPAEGEPALCRVAPP